jgi:lysophospholipase L1-like esterase
MNLSERMPPAGVAPRVEEGHLTVLPVKPASRSFAFIGFLLVVGFAGCSPSVGGDGQKSGPDGAISGTGGSVAGTGGTTAGGTGGSSVTGGSGGSPGTGGLLGTGGNMGTGGNITTGGRSGTGGTAGMGARVDAGVGGPVPDAGVSADAGTDVNQSALPNVTLHLAGDSTVMTYLVPTATADEGWGQELGQFFTSKVTINNQAIGGASVQTFYTSRWNNIMGAVKAGDYVMADFGINDSGGVAGRSVTPAAFQTLFGQMADQVKAKQATFIMVTPSALRYWVGVVETNLRLQPYVDAMNTLGPMKNVLVDDLNARSLEYLNMIGPTAAMQIYKASDKAHFTKVGATQMAKFVAEELQRIGSPLAGYLK